MLFLPRRRSKFLSTLIQKQKLSFTALLIINSLLGTIIPLFCFEVISELDKISLFVKHRDLNDMQIMPGLFCILTIGIMIIVLHHLRNILSAYFFPMLASNCRELSFSQILSNSYQFFKRNHASHTIDIINKLSNKTVDTARWLYLATMNLSAVLAITIILFVINKYLAIIFLVWWLIITIVCITASNFVCKHISSADTTNNIFHYQSTDAIANYLEVRLGNRIEKEHTIIRRRNNHVFQSVKKIGLLFFNLELMCSIFSIGIIVIFITNATLFWNEHLIATKDFAFLAASVVFIYLLPVPFLRGCITTRSAFIAIREHLKYLTNFPSAIDNTNVKDLKVSKGKIEFKKVTLKYQQNDNVFKDKTLTIQAGQKVALVGLSGSGKTTFSHMILRLIKVTSGRIFIDGQDISNVSLKSLNNSVTILEQEPRLFKRSIRDNISYGVKNASEDDIIEAAIKACCHDSIMNLDKGYDTIVGERGGKLTQGQKYRILIARAILKNSAIIIIDEPDFDLDAISAKQIKDALSYLFAKKTVIIIAHWLETLKKADRILVFSRGTIVEDGNHQELLRYDDVYASLWYMQDGGYLPGTFDK